MQVGDGHAASSESKSAGGAERRRAFAIELRKILEGGGDAGGVKGGRKGLLDVAAGAVGGLSRACSGEMQVRKYRRCAMPTPTRLYCTLARVIHCFLARVLVCVLCLCPCLSICVSVCVSRLVES